MAIDLGRLNRSQQDAVLHVDGPLLVLAGAGTGKTTVITFRICHMIENGVKPENILAMTFTNKAAREMKERLMKMLPWLGKDQITMSTFHSFCCRVMRRHAKKLGYAGGFGIADDGDTWDLVREIAKNLGLSSEDHPVNGLISRISSAKSDLLEPDDLLESTRSNRQVTGQVYKAYQERLKAMNLMDFDDLLRLTVKLWETHPNVLEAYREQYQYILVDEFQDTNTSQAALLRLIVGDAPHNICVVGDDDQSIYGWRGAVVENILDFPNNFPGTKVVRLEENYRSTNLILEAANAVIANNSKRHAKALWSAVQDGEKVRLLDAKDGEGEAKIVADIAKHYKHSRNIDFKDMAVLYRSNHLSRLLELGMRKANIPYQIIGSKSFFERREVKDAVAYLRIIANPHDDLALRRVVNVPPRGVGAKTVEQIAQFARAHGCSMAQAICNPELLHQLSGKAADGMRQFRTAYLSAMNAFKNPGNLPHKMHQYLTEIGYLDGLRLIYRDYQESLDRRDNILELITAAKPFDSQPLLDFLEANSLLDTQDKVDDKNDEKHEGVSLMTVHAAKGLEFELVVIVAMEQNTFPHERSLPDGIDEERRLFYVAITRAKRHLFLTRAKERQTFGSKQRIMKSQFLQELPRDVVDDGAIEGLYTPASSNEIQDTLSMLKARWS